MIYIHAFSLVIFFLVMLLFPDRNAMTCMHAGASAGFWSILVLGTLFIATSVISVARSVISAARTVKYMKTLPAFPAADSDMAEARDTLIHIIRTSSSSPWKRLFTSISIVVISLAPALLGYIMLWNWNTDVVEDGRMFLAIAATLISAGFVISLAVDHARRH
jgi:hypothetical protein